MGSGNAKTDKYGNPIGNNARNSINAPNQMSVVSAPTGKKGGTWGTGKRLETNATEGAKLPPKQSKRSQGTASANTNKEG